MHIVALQAVKWLYNQGCESEYCDTNTLKDCPSSMCYDTDIVSFIVPTLSGKLCTGLEFILWHMFVTNLTLSDQIIRLLRGW